MNKKPDISNSRGYMAIEPREQPIGRIESARVKRKLWRGMITADDLAAIEFLKTAHGHRFEVDVVRYCLVHEVARIDGRQKSLKPAIVERIRSSVTELKRKSRVHGADVVMLQSWSGRFSDAEFVMINRIVDGRNLIQEAEAVRLAIRSQAESDGYTPAGGQW